MLVPMLLQFSVSNFRSFRTLQTLSLAASPKDESLPEHCIAVDLPGATAKQWLKGAAIYGANASGKTTVLEALRALHYLVTNSARTIDPKDPIHRIEPFALAPGAESEPTAFDLLFVGEDGIRYGYRVAATVERIWHESLRAWPKSKMQVYYQRNWNPQAERFDWSPERPSGFRRDPQLERDTLPNVLFLSKHIASNRTELEPVFRWFKERLLMLDLSVNAMLSGDFTLNQIRKNSPLSPKILKLLQMADLNVTDARVREGAAPPHFEEMLRQMPPEMRDRVKRSDFVEPQLWHAGKDGEAMPLRWDVESAGTHRLFALAGPWLDILKDGNVVCIDELDTSMHPLMVAELLKLFFSQTENAKNAQIIFTTHNPILLSSDVLRRDQVWFTDKDKEGQSFLYPLTEYAPRKGESLIRGYLSGRYGGVPFLPKGLLGERAGFSEAKTASVIDEDQGIRD